MKIKWVLFALLLFPTFSFATNTTDTEINPAIIPKVFDVAKTNKNWKQAITTGKEAQVVMMNVDPSTNPKNEIGMEIHPFDQVIFVVKGKAKSMINDVASTVKAGDMIFVPQGMPHNFINLDAKHPFKIISIYSSTDIPANAVYKQKTDAPL